MKENSKKSIIYGGLISSAGVLLSKVLGLVYVIPFNMIAGKDIEYYGYAYTIYSYLLNISIAGIPFAIATLVAKYYNVEDYKTTLLIKKLSLGLMMALGFIGMCFVLLTSEQLATLILANGSSARDIEITKNTMMIISLALFFVPILAGYRGFYQGLKRMDYYAFSQVLEQFVRVFFLLGAGSIAVYVFKQDQIWAVYFAVFSTSVSAICALLHIWNYDKAEIKEIKQLAKSQEREYHTNPKILMKEIIVIAIPYLLSSIMAYSSNIVDLLFYSKALETTGIHAEVTKYIYGSVISVQTAKVISIPNILAIGFSASLIPYITTAIEKKDIKQVCKYIKDTLETVLYIVLPLGLCCFVFSKEIMYLLFGNETFTYSDTLTNTILSFQQLDYGNYLMRFRSIDAIFGTIAPLFTSLLIACRLRKEALTGLAIASILKLVTIYPCVQIFGMSGATFSNLFYYFAIIGYDLYWLNKKFHIRWKFTLRKLLVMLGALIITSVVYLIMSMIFGDLTRFGRIGLIPLTALEAMIVLIVYVGLTGLFQLPQQIFKLDLNTIIRKLRRK